MSDTLTTPEFSDYVAAVKRRRVLLVTIALPILAIARMGNATEVSNTRRRLIAAT